MACCRFCYILINISFITTINITIITTVSTQQRDQEESEEGEEGENSPRLFNSVDISHFNISFNAGRLVFIVTIH